MIFTHLQDGSVGSFSSLEHYQHTAEWLQPNSLKEYANPMKNCLPGLNCLHIVLDLTT